MAASRSPGSASVDRGAEVAAPLLPDEPLDPRTFGNHLDRLDAPVVGDGRIELGFGGDDALAVARRDEIAARVR